jgi:hypothetical protein
MLHEVPAYDFAGAALTSLAAMDTRTVLGSQCVAWVLTGSSSGWSWSLPSCTKVC